MSKMNVEHPILGRAICFVIKPKSVSKATGRKAEQEQRQKELDEAYEELMEGKRNCFCRRYKCNQCLAAKRMEDAETETETDESDVDAYPDLDFSEK